jgi:hypothetical protein
VWAPRTRGGRAAAGWAPARGVRDRRVSWAWQGVARRRGRCDGRRSWPTDGGRPSVPERHTASGVRGESTGGASGCALGSGWGARRAGSGPGHRPEPRGPGDGARASRRRGVSRVGCRGGVAEWWGTRGSPHGNGRARHSGEAGGGHSVWGHRGCPSAGRGAHAAPNKRLQATASSVRSAPASGRA